VAFRANRYATEGVPYSAGDGEKCRMAEMTIRLRCDPVTGKKDIVISLRSDEDALPHEHEQQHRALVDRLIEGGIVKADELGKIIVEREAKEGEAAPPVSEPPREQRRAQGQGE
jgi:hypothetical protein